MLTLTRRVGETLIIGDGVEVRVVGISRGRVRIGIKAPDGVAIHRAELIERLAEENRRALSKIVQQGRAAGAELVFDGGLLGMSEYERFLICEIDDALPIRSMVSCDDPRVQFLIIDADQVWPGYPSQLAREAFDLPEDTAVALIMNVPVDGSSPTVNLMAPLVIGLDSRQGRQVVLERSDLSAQAPLKQGHSDAESETLEV